ncbi:ABC transporter ATP-binding protein [uncultured Megasphaera sp.]|uniref:ABC transporter ATP-binding protein n=1 Tax=uncultured Megasphaera sp. TaxID=165188 RepID=UPI002599E2DF|nr:ATP-binding cassette domain-containing protein [uncultured Megasphaera sp.]
MPDITVSHLSHTYHLPDGTVVQALSDLNAHFPAGSFSVVVGPSGCGKTTLLRLLAGLETATGGQIDFGGSRPRTGVMFQSPRLLPWLTVEENVRIWQYGMGGSTELAAQYLHLFGLDSFRKAYPDQLSGGMAQRVALVRTLACQPQLLLLDEPFAALDYFTREKLQDELMEQYVRQPLTIIFITHDLDEALRLGERILVLRHGRQSGLLTRSEPYPRQALADRTREKQTILQLLEEPHET